MHNTKLLNVVNSSNQHHDLGMQKRSQQDSHGLSNFSNDESSFSQPNMGAANQQDVITQFQHSSHGYHHSSNINWYPQQQIHSAQQHPSNEIRNQNSIHSNSQSQNANQILQSNYNQGPDSQTQNYMTGQDPNQLKNQRKVGLVQRANYRPRSQTSHQNGKQAI